MRESTQHTILKILPVGRGFGLVLFGMGLGIAVTPSIFWGVVPAWNRQALLGICFGIVCFTVSVVAERHARRLLGEPRSLDAPS